ncbi:hypothetical protein [Evansella cellulosilytica]|uniref:Nucleotidase n=1 Tax=Evansella cellulosilytica (strain ATCC 21833 / DSM 2522 / FERM P-1141 / JCM 9156 / N-4) TaxID=649639 RepID=E6TWU9_EVAC2|nr:hypothetical protein [Evansella cellulosilytica]ADU29899.1 hypothetical protein Bcell_1636 [Evansella cellulosilytica DSM 2522]
MEKTNKLRIGIDIDGTVTDPGTFIPYLNKHFNKSLTLKDITQYELSGFLGITKEAFLEWMKIHEPFIYKEAVLASHVEDTLKNWNISNELYYISARPPAYYNLTKTWFDQYDLPYDHIELLGKHDKLDTIKKHNIDIFFEDKHDNACLIAEHCDIPVILIDTPYNQENIPKQVYRAQNWSVVPKLMKEIFSPANK